MRNDGTTGGGQHSCGCNGGGTAHHAAMSPRRTMAATEKSFPESDQTVNPNMKSAAQPHRAKPRPAPTVDSE